jgi:hypothetical protein
MRSRAGRYRVRHPMRGGWVRPSTPRFAPRGASADTENPTRPASASEIGDAGRTAARALPSDRVLPPGGVQLVRSLTPRHSARAMRACSVRGCRASIGAVCRAEPRIRVAEPLHCVPRPKLHIRLTQPHDLAHCLELFPERLADRLAMFRAVATDHRPQLNPAGGQLNPSRHSQQPTDGLAADLARPDT